jgi:ABC-2 type transport system permease protein
LKHTFTILRRELQGYFATPVAYVFIVIFLMLSSFMTFSEGFGGLYERNQADGGAFFSWHPWLYLFLIPALSMRLWAEERRSGTIELLMTLPITMSQAILGKFLAAWAFTGICLLGTVPTWITLEYLGEPDNMAIATGYFGSFLMAGGFLAIGSAISSSTKNQVVAFVMSVVPCFAFILIGFTGVGDWLGEHLPEPVVATIASFSFLDHFSSMQRGLVELRDIVFFGSLIVFFLFLNALILDAKKAS